MLKYRVGNSAFNLFERLPIVPNPRIIYPFHKILSRPISDSLLYSQSTPFLGFLRHVLTRATIVVMCHLQSCSLVSALNIESFVGLTTVENALVATNFLRDEIEGLDKFQSEFLPLLILCDGDIFNVANEAEVMDAVKC